MEGIKKALDLSKLTLGTMRFHDKQLTVSEVIAIIDEGYEIGIDTHHSSIEYSSYELYIKALEKSQKRKQLKYIVKLSSPHFEDDAFSATILENRVDNQLKKLQIDCIDVLQWLVRSKPIDDEVRFQTLKDQQEEISNSIEDLKKKGKIKTCFSFPYSVKFAKKVLEFDQVDGLVTYLNKEELEYQEFANTVPFIAIRPLFAGKLIEKSTNIDAEIISSLRFVENHKKVFSTIVGINSTKQLQTYKKYLK